MEYSADGLAIFLRDAADARVGPFQGDAVTGRAVQDWLATGAGHHMVSGPVSRARLYRAMSATGWLSRAGGEAGVWTRPQSDTTVGSKDVRTVERKTARILAMPKQMRNKLGKRKKWTRAAEAILEGTQSEKSAEGDPPWL